MLRLHHFTSNSQLAPVFASYADITNIVSLLLPATVVYILSMAIEDQRGEPFVFCVQPPLSRRVIPLAYTALLLLCAAYIPLKVGLSRFSEGFGNHPALWFLAIGLVAAIALALRLAFPPRGAQPRLQIRHDSVRFIPGRVERHLFAEPAIEAAITPQSREILLCHSFLEELPDGYRVIIRAADETEREVRARFLTLLDAQEYRKIVEGITGATALPVRLVIRRRLADGTVQETPLIPLAPKANIARGFAAVTIGAVPYIGGITIGYLLPRPAVIVAVGLALWLGQMLAVSAFAHRHRTRNKYPTLYSLTTLFTFGATYGFAVVVVAFMRGFPGWRPWLLRLFLAVLVLLACPDAGWAQVSAAISGRVEDASGAAVSGATVTVKDVETGATRVVTTDPTGNYRVLSLPIGLHEIRTEKEGFKAAVRTGVKLDVGQEAVVNLRLEVGEVVQQIVVSEEVPVVNTTTAPVSGLVGEREIKDLPLNGRSFDNLITLNPGTINYTALRGPNTTTSNGSAYAVDGQRPGDNLTLLNGVEYTGSSQLAVTPGGVSGNLLGIDAVREFNVLTGDYGAEYGKREGAQVSVVTQSGSNTMHGTLYEFVRNSALDGRSYFDQGLIPPFQQNQFGGSLGGPIKKNRLFLFGNYEGFRQSLAVSNLSVVPDAMARQGSLPNASCVEAPVPSLNPAMLPYMSFWPQQNGTELGGGCFGEALSFDHPEQSIREDFGTLRADYILSDRDTLSGAYTIDDGNGLIPLANPLFASALALRSQVISLQETHILSPRVLNSFTAGFSRAGFANDSAPQASFSPSLSFVSGASPGGIVIGGGVTTTANGTITSAGPNNASSVWNRRNLFTFTNNLQISRGIHQISLGIWLQPLQDNEDTASRQLGQASFSTLQTFLQGTVRTFQVVPTATELGWRSLMGAWYVQDAIKLRSNLTFEVGIRHEFDTGWNEEAGRASNFVTDANGVLVTTPRIGDSAFTQNNAKLLFGPRVALAWDPSGHGTTAVHAGFGIHYSF
jgi:hypothetical protein